MATKRANRESRRISLSVLLALFLGLAGLLAVPGSASAEFETPQQAPWGVKTKGTATSVAGWDALGWSLAQVDGHVYLGGNFLEVTNGWKTESQPYFARFDTTTGVFDESFRPDVGNAIYALEPSPDGGLFVGGEFGSWNGQSIGALAKIDPATGERWPGFDTRVYGGSSTIRDLKVEADGWVYASGSFTTAGSGGNTVAVKNVVRFDPVTGAIDANWRPQPNGLVHGVSRSKTKSVTYIAGKFTDVNGDANTAGFVGLDDQGQVSVNRPNDTLNRQLVSCPARLGPPYCSQMYDVEATAQGDVWITGVEHATYQIDEGTNQTKKAHFTVRGPVCWGLNAAEREGIQECRSGGGDGQELYVVGDRVYATCHCFGGIYSSDDPTDLYIPPTGWANTPIIANGYVMPVSGVIAFDATSGNVDTNFNPYMAGTSGGWAVLDTDDGCLWVTGDFSQVGEPGVEATAPGRDLVRLCDGGVAPDVPLPASCTVTLDNGVVEVEWTGAPSAIGYTVYRSINGGNQNWRGRVNNGLTFSDPAANSGVHRYFVASVRPNGTSTDRRQCTPDVDPAANQGPVTAPVSCSVTVNGQTATIDWPAVNGATGYRIYRSVDGGNEFWRGRVNNATQFNDTLRTGSHQYLVSAIKPDGTATTRTPCGNPVTPGAGQGPITAPVSCSVTVNGQTATIDWPAVNGATGYRIYRSVDGGNEFWRGRVNNATQFNDTLRTGSHQYLVSAIKPDGTATTRTPCGNPVTPG